MKVLNSVAGYIKQLDNNMQESKAHYKEVYRSPSDVNIIRKFEFFKRRDVMNIFPSNLWNGETQAIYETMYESGLI